MTGRCWWRKPRFTKLHVEAMGLIGPSEQQKIIRGEQTKFTRRADIRDDLLGAGKRIDKPLNLKAA